MRNEFMWNHQKFFPVELMYQVLGVGKTGSMRSCIVLAAHETEPIDGYLCRLKRSISEIGRRMAVLASMQT